MTPAWILIVILYGAGPLPAMSWVPNFATEQACMDAGRATVSAHVEVFSKSPGYACSPPIAFRCVPNGVEK